MLPLRTLVITLAIAGCGSNVGQESADLGHTSVRIDGPVFYAPVVTASRPLPRRYRAALPQSLEDWEEQPQHWPPYRWVSEAVCSGDERLREQLVDRLRGHAEEGWRGYTGGFASALGCSDQPPCDWLGDALEDEPNGVVRGALLFQSVACEEPLEDFSEWSLDPWLQMLLWRKHRELPTSTDLFEAAEEIWGRYPDDADVVAEALAAHDDPRSASLLVRMYRAVEEPGTKAVIAGAMRRQSDGTARRIHAASCLSEGALPVPCAPFYVEQSGSLREAVQVPHADLDGIVAAHPQARGDVLDALSSCAAAAVLADEAQVQDVPAACLYALSRHDRARAAEVAISLQTLSAWSVEDRERVRAIAQYPSRDGLLGTLDVTGFAGPQDGPPGASPFEILVDRGHALELGAGSSEYRRLLTRAAGLAGLQGWRFDHREPLVEGGHAVLFAFHGGERHYALATTWPNGAWDDQQAIGMLNSLLEKSGSERRVAMLAGLNTRLIAGDVESLTELQRTGLFEWWVVPVDFEGSEEW